MEPLREHFRAMIFYDFKSGLNQAQSFEILTQAFGNLAPSRATILNWFAAFKRGRTSLEDEGRSGRQSTVVTEENVDAVEKMVREAPGVTYKDIEATLTVGSESVAKILHTDLRVSKVSSRWVPHSLTDGQKGTCVEWCCEMLQRFGTGNSRRVSEIITSDKTWIYQYDPETKRQSSVWVFPDDDRPVKVKRAKSVGKKMVLTFFGTGGHVATIPLEHQRTVTVQWYTTVTLPKIKRKATKNGTEGHPVAPRQCLCPHGPFDNGFSEGDSRAAVILTDRTWHPVTSFCSLR